MERNTFKIEKAKIEEEKEEAGLKEYTVYWYGSVSGITRVKAHDEDEARELAEEEGSPDNYDTDNWEISEVEERRPR
jgi:hypothetical protein